MHDRAMVEAETNERLWRRTALAFLGTFFAALTLVLAALVLIDPFDSGRFPTFMPAGSPDNRPPTLGISRGRDPRFDAVVLGSSRGVMLDPEPLRRATRFNFVQMAAAGTGPKDQMALLHWFARHRPIVRAIVIAYDATWCIHDPALPGLVGFPYGLYSDNSFDYFAATFNMGAMIYARDRILMAFGKLPPVDPADFHDFEATAKRWVPKDSPEYRPPHATLARLSATTPPVQFDDIFPAIDLFDAELQKLPNAPLVVLWTPPLYHTELPAPGTPGRQIMAGCKQAAIQWASVRPGTAFLDFAIDTPEIHDPSNFLDGTHIRKVLMRKLEPQIIGAINQLDRIGAEP